jgi:hypothetical protein
VSVSIDVAADGVRVLALHDGYDRVGEIRLELAGPVALETLELVQDLFGFGLGRRVRARELTLMRAAVAVNAAKSFDQALEVLAETCCRITDTPMCGVIVWEPGFEFATIRAGAGDALRMDPLEIGDVDARPDIPREGAVGLV